MSLTQQLANYKMRQPGTLDRPSKPVDPVDLFANGQVSGDVTVSGDTTVTGAITLGSNATLTIADGTTLTVV